MSRPRLLPAAEDELVQAVDWYEARRVGLGLEFFAAIDIVMRDIGEAPERFPVLGGGQAFRRAVVRRLPYVLIYRVLEDGPQVVAVAHTRRRPGYWLERVG